MGLPALEGRSGSRRMTGTPAGTGDLTAEAIEAGRQLFARPASFAFGVASLAGLPPADRPEVCFAGRSNVGKSSLINALTGQSRLARASAEPGRTRELNFFDVGEGQLWLVDMPGFGYARVAKAEVAAWTRLIKSYLRGRPNLRRVFLLVDARRGLMDTDRHIISLLDEAAVVYQAVLTKTDKLPRSETERAAQAVTGELCRHAAAHPIVRQVSAEKGWGIDLLRADIAALTLP